jgi:tetratricopeptide (TPR) repeat protein
MSAFLARSLNFALILIACTTFVSAQRTARPVPAASIEITGQVRYAEGGAPADKILVRLEAFGGGMIGQILTDRTGKFRFMGLTPAIYVVTIHSPGFIDIRQQVDLQTSTREYLQLQIVPEKAGEAKAASSSLILDASIPPEAQKEFDQGRTLLFDEKKVESCITHLEKAVKLHPSFIEAHLLLGTAYLDNNQLEKAERELRRTLELDPKAAPAYFALGEAYRKLKKNDEAEQALREGLKLEPRSHQGHFTLGQVYYAKGDITKAGPEVGQALQLKPDFAEAYLLAGNLFLRARKAESALQMYAEYLRLDPKGQFAEQTRAQVEKIKKALGEKK